MEPLERIEHALFGTNPYSVSIGLEATELDALPAGWIIDLD
jgi:hypothetical protein